MLSVLAYWSSNGCHMNLRSNWSAHNGWRLQASRGQARVDPTAGVDVLDRTLANPVPPGTHRMAAWTGAPCSYKAFPGEAAALEQPCAVPRVCGPLLPLKSPAQM